jgi:hypothetical protein
VAVLRGVGFGVGFAFAFALAFAFAAAADAVRAGVAVTAGEAVSDARGEPKEEPLTAGEVLAAGVVFPQPSAIPMMPSMITPATAMPTLCSFFICKTIPPRNT